MPEGDSVHRLARRLDARLAGRRVVRSDLRHPRLVGADLAGRHVIGHDTHGKHLLTRFSAADRSGGSAGSDEAPPLTLHSHLRMDGEWTVTRPGRRLPARLGHEVRLVLALDDGATVWGLRLHDLALVPTRDERRLLAHLGPDPLREDWDAAEAARRLLADPAVPLAAALLDQRRVAGFGNLWANELCFLAGVSPWTPVGEVDVPALLERGAAMLRRSATVPGAHQVTTGSRRRGNEHWVTGRVRQGCLRCGGPVRVAAEVPGDPARRRTWWCPACQPGPGPTDGR
ncbi:DNA-formamidopyrimidine glycosylase family protein [Phycicoccus avicenniae]|uniref:DNA-formamidopyrimidine glycosylase family protein n=1 Tax=Phycicoccus avicenniae TaxID=2828860 RepID=UPI003D2D34DC